MNLTDFLLARVAEDEEWARVPRAVHDVVWEGPPTPGDPARVLAECEAKRRIIAMDTSLTEPESLTDRVTFPSVKVATEFALIALAAVYSDHPEFEEAWRV